MAAPFQPHSKHSSALLLSTLTITLPSQKPQTRPQIKNVQRGTLFFSPQLPLEPLSNVTFWLSLSLSPDANPRCPPHRAPQLPLHWVRSVSHRSSGWILVLHGRVQRRQGQALFRGVQCKDNKYGHNLQLAKFLLHTSKYFFMYVFFKVCLPQMQTKLCHRNSGQSCL